MHIKKSADFCSPVTNGIFERPQHRLAVLIIITMMSFSYKNDRRHY